MIRHVIVKLLAFTLAMVVCPIGSYFLTLNYVFNGKHSLSISPSPEELDVNARFRHFTQLTS